MHTFRFQTEEKRRDDKIALIIYHKTVRIICSLKDDFQIKFQLFYEKCVCLVRLCELSFEVLMLFHSWK